MNLVLLGVVVKTSFLVGHKTTSLSILTENQDIEK